MKKIGIITMHRPLSFGSALQAYALQKKISDLGYDAEIIDYQYPNQIHGFNRSGFKAVFNTVSSFFMNALFGFPNVVKKKRFDEFRRKNIKLSRYYPTAESLVFNPPKYDIYCTGSDQVWNALFTKGDTSFLLSFIKGNKKKISYASSFSINYIPDEYKKNYLKYLAEYQTISVREESGVGLVRELSGKEALWVCDPTLLLSKTEWDKIADQSHIQIEGHYILAFMLCYSFNPYPEVQRIIDSVQRDTGLTVVYLDGGKKDYLRHNSKVIKSAGPAEFVELIRHADYIITTSFHGVVFSSIFGKPFTAIIKNGNNDSRIQSFLYKVGLSQYASSYDADSIELSEKCDAKCILPFVSESVRFLRGCLEE